MVFYSDHRTTNFTVEKLAKLRLQLRGELWGTMIYYYDSAIFVIDECILILTIIFLEQSLFLFINDACLHFTPLD